MDITKVDQSGSVVGGDQAGRDIIKVAAPKPTAMSRLIEKYEKEISENSVLSDMISELRHLANPVSYDLRGLEDKLVRGEREDLVDQAMYLKEIASKEFVKVPNTESAQKIYALVLGKMWSSFTNRVSPLIKEGKTRAEIDEAIQVHVIECAAELLETNPLCLSDLHIMGLYYFLAGNCHISWDPK